MLAAAQIRDMGRSRESCACMMEVNKQAQDGRATSWQKGVEKDASGAQSVREDIFRLWLVFQRKRARKDSCI